MQRNVGGFDRIARLVAGPVLIVAGAAAFTGLLTLPFPPLTASVVAGVLLLFGAVFLATGLARTCPLYSVLGIDTCSVGTPENDSSAGRAD